jgi:lysophospholipase L1-like esterase
MNNNIPFFNLSLSGDALSSSRRLRLPLIQGGTDVLTNLGINDLSGVITLAALQVLGIAAWFDFARYSARVWQTTITPHTSSSDTWATAANQTPFTNNAIRIAYNDWIRDGAPMLNGVAVAAGSSAPGTIRAGAAGHPLAGYFEVADAVEVDSAGTLTRNGGRWKVGSVYTTDAQGIHPNSTGAAAMAPAIDTSKFLRV